jgi:hypothetical protein
MIGDQSGELIDLLIGDELIHFILVGRTREKAMVLITRVLDLLQAE